MTVAASKGGVEVRLRLQFESSAGIGARELKALELELELEGGSWKLRVEVKVKVMMAGHEACHRRRVEPTYLPTCPRCRWVLVIVIPGEVHSTNAATTP